MNRKFTSVFFVLCSLLFFSCFKKTSEGPPDQSAYDPHLTVTHTIAQLLSKPQGVQLSEDIIISGIVVMDDKSGNYYKKIVIEDSTAGVELELDQNNLYNDYPVGRKVYIKCKGLYIGNTSGNPQLGYTPDKTGSISAIPAVLVDDYLVKANYPNPIAPDTYLLADLKDLDASHLNTLIAIRNVEFADTCIGIPYAELASLSSATSLGLKDCVGGKAILRSSGYAKFQPYITPSGNGILVALFTKYRTDFQLYIRDTSDVKFLGDRCGGSNPNPGGAVRITHIGDLRAMTPTSNDSIKSLPATSITGIVISDKNALNIVTANLVMQDGDRGITIRLSGNHSFSTGDSITIDITGAKLSWYNKMLQVSGVPLKNAVRSAKGKFVKPRIATLSECISNYSDWESTLVKVNAVSVSGGGTYSGNKTITDNTGSFVMFTRNVATFALTAVPATPKSFTGILGIYGYTKQLQLRNLDDVQ